MGIKDTRNHLVAEADQERTKTEEDLEEADTRQNVDQWVTVVTLRAGEATEEATMLQGERAEEVADAKEEWLCLDSTELS